MKNCDIIVSADKLFQPEQSKPLTSKERTNEQALQVETAIVEVSVKQSPSMTKLSSMKETAQQFSQLCEEMEKVVQESEEQKQLLEGQLQVKVALINQQQEKLSANEIEIEKVHGELREKQGEIDTIKEESEQQLRDQ